MVPSFFEFQLVSLANCETAALAVWHKLEEDADKSNEIGGVPVVTVWHDASAYVTNGCVCYRVPALYPGSCRSIGVLLFVSGTRSFPQLRPTAAPAAARVAEPLSDRSR